MKIEIKDAGVNNEGYAYHISIPGHAGITSDEYASLSELFRDLMRDDFVQACIDKQLNAERKAGAA